MSFRSVRYARAAMAAPAVLLFLVMCLAQIFGGSSSEGNGSENIDDNHHLVRGSGGISGSSIDVDVGEINSISDNSDGSKEENNISVQRHGHKKKHSAKPKHDSNNNGSNSNNDEKDDSFDYYVYSMSFQPEFCRENNEKFAGCQNFREIWEGQLTIHGLWPNRDDGTWPSMCTNEQLDTSLLQDLSDDLETRWPNIKAMELSTPSHEAFWSHEWSKHGTCSGMTQHDYFATALDLLVPTPEVVKKNYGSVVKRSELEEGYLGNDMSVFVCKYGYLSEVRVCYEKMPDLAVGERVTCPEANLKADSCGDEIKIASFASGKTPTAVE